MAAVGFEPTPPKRLGRSGYTCRNADKNRGSGGIRTHASEETGALNQRLRPLGHATLVVSTLRRLVAIKINDLDIK
ncbi:hypothetical protein J437_LFUL007544 [Ladona fulva]|uniref:Uncharacterized protein n=1 Tax=Ladona fulva TaxID=123851 RepID=A0A8K0K3P6_LADFU|nr:hypothetical protein J437_LFUL007544 [Ladona fulva]